MVGINNRSMGVATVSFKYKSWFLYTFNDLTKTLLGLLTDNRHDNYYVDGYVPFYVILFYCFMICMISRFSMQIDIISKLPYSVATRSANIFVNSHGNTDALFSSIINWTV